MATRARRGGGVGGFLMKGLLFVVAAGLLLALLRAFNWDPFGVVSWAGNLGWSVIDWVSDLFSSNETFQKVTEAPGIAWKFPHF